jgi:voltage-gated potassium channel
MHLFRLSYTTFILVVLTLLVQSAGMATLIRWLKPQFSKGIHLDVFRSIMLMVRFTGLLVCLHFVQIALWMSFYRLKCIDTWEAAFYFSAGQYSSVGSALVLSQKWRVIAPIESVTGVLMCGLSAGLLFAVVTRLVGAVDPEIVAPEIGNRDLEDRDQAIKGKTSGGDAGKSLIQRVPV